ncbi:MAG: sn-glycerol-3-phosphate ABC transporter permease UgpA [Methylobacteriaceae bacterium]|nr:sn-glycerol-3-phosphate ABC transporter permease UgpA [Methylobacteriaceae bacterium]
MQAKRVTFPGRILPALLLLPQLAITAVFFLWPSAEALWQSLRREDAFGTRSEFVGLDNFRQLFADPAYLASFSTTLVFSASVALLSLALGLLFAVLTERVGRGRALYQSLLIWPYAVAPALAALMWSFLFDPSIGPVAKLLGRLGLPWNHQVNGGQALILIVIASTWKQVSYNFLFFVAGLAAIPRSLLEAAAIDAASPWRTFWTIVFPLLAPTSFFLLVVNIVYAFFDTFGVVHATTQGGPAQATTTLVYKVFRDGFVGLDLGGSAAQSVVLLAIVIALTAVQFRFVERRVHY